MHKTTTTTTTTTTNPQNKPIASVPQLILCANLSALQIQNQKQRSIQQLIQLNSTQPHSPPSPANIHLTTTQVSINHTTTHHEKQTNPTQPNPNQTNPTQTNQTQTNPNQTNPTELNQHRNTTQQLRVQCKRVNLSFSNQSKDSLFWGIQKIHHAFGF